jgi:hypothetical protein
MRRGFEPFSASHAFRAMAMNSGPRFERSHSGPGAVLAERPLEDRPDPSRTERSPTSSARHSRVDSSTSVRIPMA